MTYRHRRSRKDIEKRLRALQLTLIKVEFEMSQGHGNDILKTQFLWLTHEINVLNWVLMKEGQ